MRLSPGRLAGLLILTVMGGAALLWWRSRPEDPRKYRRGGGNSVDRTPQDDPAEVSGTATHEKMEAKQPDLPLSAAGHNSSKPRFSPAQIRELLLLTNPRHEDHWRAMIQRLLDKSDPLGEDLLATFEVESDRVVSDTVGALLREHRPEKFLALLVKLSQGKEASQRRTAAPWLGRYPQSEPLALESWQRLSVDPDQEIRDLASRNRPFVPEPEGQSD